MLQLLREVNKVLLACVMLLKHVNFWHMFMAVITRNIGKQ